MPRAKGTKQNKHLWERHPDDWYVEPDDVSERFLVVEPIEKGATILDPACGLGRICAAARRAGHYVIGSDIAPRWELPVAPQDYGPMGRAVFKVADFIDGWPPNDGPGWRFPDVIISNPPFKYCSDDAKHVFVRRCLERAVTKVALILPTVWANGEKTSKWLETTPLYREYRISPRPSMPPGPVIEAGEDVGGGTKDFSIFVWLRGFAGRPEVHWLRRRG